MRELMELKNIKMTLKYGWFIYGTRFKVIIACFVPSCFSFIMNVFAFADFLLNKIEIDLFLSYFFISSGFFVLMLYFLLVSVKRQNEVKKWLKDAVRVNASITRMIPHSLNAPNQISVSFMLNNQKYFIAGPKGNIVDGYRQDLLKCIGNKVPILYSKLYNQVMILYK